jgi:serine/threonine protein kinase
VPERKVALKILKPELAVVARGERFLAEIKTTANLQHPHILPLHDSGEADGARRQRYHVPGPNRPKPVGATEFRICGEVGRETICVVRSGSIHRRMPEHRQEEQQMPLFMDIHKGVDGLTAKDVAEAHEKDLKTQAKHGVKYLRYWFNEDDGTVFCLSEAPSKEAAEAVHREAHGLVADEIIEVQEGQ